MAFETFLRGVAVKIETVSGTDSVPTAANDAVLCSSIDLSEPMSGAVVKRTVIRPFFGNQKSLIGALFAKIDLEVEMAGFGTAGPAMPTPGLDALFRACGHSRIVTAGTSVGYFEASTALSTATVYFWQDGTRHAITGAFGDMSAEMTEDGIPVWRFSLVGVYQPVVDGSFPTFSLGAYVEPVLCNSANTTAISVQGYAALVRTFSFAQNSVLNRNALMGGARNVSLTNREASGSIEIRATTVAARNWWTAIAGSTLGAFSIMHGSVSGNRVQFNSAAGLQLLNPRFVEDRGVANIAFDMAFVPSNAGNDAYLWTLT